MTGRVVIPPLPLRPLPLLAWCLVGLSIVLPWLNPFSPGPAPGTLPLLFAWACAAVVLALVAWRPHSLYATQGAATVAWAWTVAAALSAVIGLLQYTGHSAGWGGWVNITALGEAFGNLRQRNHYATHMAIGLAALLWLAAQPRSAGVAARWQAVWLALAALLGVASAASSSRTGLLQWLVLIGLAWWWQRAVTGAAPATRQRVMQVAAAAALGYLAGTWLLPLLVGLDPLQVGALARLRQGDPACASRLTLWGNVLHLISLQPRHGWGWGELDYAHLATLYPGARFCDILDNAHNLPLHLAVEMGVPTAVLVSLMGLGVVVWMKPWGERRADRQLGWAVLAVIGLHSLLEYPLWYGPFQMAAVLAAWLVARTTRLPRVHPNMLRQNPAVALMIRALPAICLGATVAWLWHNYQLASQPYLAPEQRRIGYRDDPVARLGHLPVYHEQVAFAALTTTPVTPATAAVQHARALALLHFSPEAAVLRVLLDSAMLLGRADEVMFWAPRFAAAFPADYAAWRQRHPALPPDAPAGPMPDRRPVPADANGAHPHGD